MGWRAASDELLSVCVCLCVWKRQSERVTSSDVSYKVRTEHFPEVLHLISEANLQKLID